MTRRPKGTGSILTTPDGKHRALFPIEGKRREVTGSPFATKADAEQALDILLAEYQSESRGGPSLMTLGPACLDQREKAGYRAVEDDRNRWKCYVEPWELFRVPAHTITRGDVREWLAGIQKATQTKRNALNLLRAVFTYAVDAEKLTDNPCDGVKVKDHGSTEEGNTHLTLVELDALVGCATDPAVALAAGTGMRSGELRALRWEDVSADQVTVRYGKPGKPSKSGRIRRVPILPMARRALQTLRDQQGGVADAGIVLPAVLGGYRGKGQVVARLEWLAWKQAAGITRRVRFHDLRHTCATLLLNGAWGEPWTFEEVKEMLGHSSVKVTERYAKNLGTLAEKAAQNKIGIGSAATSPEAVKAREILGRRGGGSNSRMTVLQAQPDLSVGAGLDAIPILLRSFLEAAADGAPFALARGLDLAEAVERLDVAMGDRRVG